MVIQCISTTVRAQCYQLQLENHCGVLLVVSVIKCEIANHMCSYLIASMLSNYNGYIHNDFIR